MRISDWSSDVCSSDLMWKTGRAHPASSNMMKYVGTELNKRRHELVLSGGGSEALAWDSEETKGGARARGWLRTKANTREGGTTDLTSAASGRSVSGREDISGRGIVTKKKT